MVLQKRKVYRSSLDYGEWESLKVVSHLQRLRAKDRQLVTLSLKAGIIPSIAQRPERTEAPAQIPPHFWRSDKEPSHRILASIEIE